MLGWLLNSVYSVLLIAVSPMVLWRALRHGRYRRGWREKLLGVLPQRTDFDRPLVWCHAVSVGEVVLLRGLLQRWREKRPDLQFLVTTSTDTGFDLARDSIPECEVSWMPLDFTWSIRRALQRVRPDLIVLVELELWPNLLRIADQSHLPLVLVNARMSERSFHGYSWIRPLVGSLMRQCRLILAQNSEYAARFRDLGALPERVQVGGSIKFDGVETHCDNDRTQGFRELLGVTAEEMVLIAGSTQSPEEAAVLAAWEAALQRYPKLRLILVPRHLERFDEVAALIEARGHRVLRRSQLGKSIATDRGATGTVLLWDTIGELAAVWGLADLAYVGGSLTPGRGGQNMLEPAAYGAAVLFGPHTENFRSIVESLMRQGAAVVVPSAEGLRAAVMRLLDQPEERRELGERAREAVIAEQGATQRTLAALASFVPKPKIQRHRAA